MVDAGGLTNHESASFIAGLAIAAAQEFLRTRDQCALAARVAELMQQVEALPSAVAQLPLIAPISLLAQTLMLAATATEDKHEWLVLAIYAHERLVRLANRDAREPGAGECAA